MDHVSTIGTSCLNCGAALDGPYCSHCGQRDVPPTPHVHELLHDALEEFLHFDGKIVQTIRTLITRPGALTCDIVAGRRARYIAPLRLYLTCSLLYFVIAAASPTRNASITFTSSRGGVTTRVQRASDLSEEDRRRLLDGVSKAPTLLQPLIHRLLEDPAGLQRDVFAAWPKALFVLVPAFAVIVALFYRRRHFIEHMYFALHLHAFAFLAMTASAVVAFAHVRPLAIAVGVGVLLWIPIYVHLAFRRVYGGTHFVTALKETGVGLLYAVASVPALLVAALWAASHPH